MSQKYTSIYTGEDGRSHFRSGEIELAERIIGPGIPPLGATAHHPARAWYLLTFPPGILLDWHPAPARLFHFFLAGQCEVTVEDGEVREFRTGDLVLVEDLVGKGHVTRNNGPVETLMIVVVLPQGEETNGF